MTYTAVPTVTTGELWTAANQNTYLRDNLAEFNNRSPTQVFVPGHTAYNSTDTATIEPTEGVGSVYVLPDNKDCYVYGKSILPTLGDYDVDISAVVVTTGGGNMWSRVGYYYGDIGTEDYSNSSDTGSLGAAGLSALVLEKVNTRSLTGTTNNDLLTFFFERDGANASDTIGASVNFQGFLLEVQVS